MRRVKSQMKSVPAIIIFVALNTMCLTQAAADEARRAEAGPSGKMEKRTMQKDVYQQLWDERLKALEKLFGPSSDTVHHAKVPLYLGGFADVLEFRKYVKGICYVTADLSGEPSQQQNSLGNYELMVCTRESADWSPSIISRLAKYTLEAVLQPGDTMDIGSALPAGSTGAAFLFTEPSVSPNAFTVGGKRSGVLLCIVITSQELQACMRNGSSKTLQRLKESGIFPFSDLKRRSINEP